MVGVSRRVGLRVYCQIYTSYKRVALIFTPIMRLGYIHTSCQLMCINNTRGASELEILSISKSKSIRVISKTYKSHIYSLCESVTLGDEFLSVDQLTILIFLCHNRIYSYYKKKRHLKNPCEGPHLVYKNYFSFGNV